MSVQTGGLSVGTRSSGELPSDTLCAPGGLRLVLSYGTRRALPATAAAVSRFAGDCARGNQGAAGWRGRVDGAC